MSSVSLPELVQAIANAVIEAQDQIDKHQLALLQRYFDDDDRPKSASMVVQSLSLTTAEEKPDVRINVPWLALIRPTLLSISEVQVDFEVELTDFAPGTAATPHDGASNAADADKSGKFPSGAGVGNMMVEVGARKTKEEGATARVILKVAGQEPSEGMARMVHELVKRIMIIGEE